MKKVEIEKIKNTYISWTVLACCMRHRKSVQKKNIREPVKIKSPVFKAVVFKFVDDK